MDYKKLGLQTIAFATPPVIIAHGNVVGTKEGQGPLAECFDFVSQDDYFGQKSWEKAEYIMQQQALQNALDHAGMTDTDLDFLLAGDLLNQYISSSFAARSHPVSFLGLYGACSTMGESLLLAATLIDGGYGKLAAAMTSSHFCTAERQFRAPLAYGGQRPPTAQWTVTGSGAVLVSNQGRGPKITHATVGKIVDKGITDANNMGAAMAPAAYDTLQTHFRDTGRTPEDYDLIVTGDLGRLGHEIVTDFFAQDGVKLRNYTDCGLLIYDMQNQDVHCGGSGCGCAATVLTGHLLPAMEDGRYNRILFCPTGALLSPTTTQQGESIPSICHAVALEM